MDYAFAPAKVHRNKHRVGISLGVSIVALGGGVLGYTIGQVTPQAVTAMFGVTGGIVPFISSFAAAVLAAAVWVVGEAITGILRFVDREAVLARLMLSLTGSTFSVISAELDLLGIHLFHSSSSSLFAYTPLATGLGSIALGVHAIAHQIHLNRENARK